MTPTPQTEAWTLFADGSQLSDRELLALTEALEDSIVGREFACDQRLHRTLSGMRHVDETREDFIAQVEQACSKLSLNTPTAIEPISATTFDSQTDVLLNQESASLAEQPPGRQKQPVWMHPLVVVLSGTTILAAVILFIAVGRLGTLSDEVAGLRKDIREQRLDFQRKLSHLKKDLKPIRPAQWQPRPSPRNDQAAEPQEPIAKPVAMLTRVNRAEWEVAPVDEQLNAGPLNLTKGEAALQMGDGTELQLDAPVRLRLLNSGHVLLERGNIRASAENDDRGFRVSTPTAQIVDLGRDFTVAVDKVGDTDVEALDGELVVIPVTEDPDVRRWHLIPGRFAQAMITKPERGNGQLLCSTVEGPAGFQGQLQLAGNGIVLDDADRFRKLQNSVLQRFQQAPQQALQDWLQLAESVNSISATVNGQKVALDFFAPPGEQTEPPDPSNNRMEMFAGKVLVNGQQRSFHSKEEFDAFRRQMTQPFPSLMPGKDEKTQFELDMETNPFLPQD